MTDPRDLRLQIPQAARLVGRDFASERTLHDWFRPYRPNRTPRGYPLELVLRVLGDHGWRGDPSPLAAAAERAAQEAQEPQGARAIVPASETVAPALAAEVAALRSQLAQESQARAAAEAAVLDELRGIRAALEADLAARQQQAARLDALERAVGAAQAEAAELRAALAPPALPASRKPAWWAFWRRGE